MAFSLYYIGYIFIIHDGFNEPLRHVIKYKNSPLSQDVKDDIWKEVNSYLIDRDMYRSSNLRLSEISQDLGYPVHYISQIINEKSEDNFSAYVNYLRIEYAKNILSTKKDVKISDLIIDSGFNSKSSFYTEFKKYTGLTPLEFKNA
ncbi:AraC family transcriptional regulator [Winogradskyella sp.]|uniref:helix-turn-helix domain-containing protein n=1 Tax=Winogradskyella sp. TaxID=1883156 RepID=UPI00263368BC|nr:helix-turn-helix domain-containing protein [Winogradskyella sp.]